MRSKFAEMPHIADVTAKKYGNRLSNLRRVSDLDQIYSKLERSY